MLIHQQIYGKTNKRDFSTLATSIEMARQDLGVIEKNCRFKLPLSMLYELDVPKPRKYVYYPLNDEQVIIGRGVDIGRDEFGRAGNFLFHNLIIRRDEIEKFGQNPVRLIQYLEERGIFKDNEFTEEHIDKLELEIIGDNGSKVSLQNLFANDSNFLPLLLYACSKYKEISNPIYIIGSEDKIFSFIEKIFDILPKRLWGNISFNTFWYQDAESFFCGIGIREEEKRLTNYSLKIDLENESYDSKINIQDKTVYEYAILVANMALSDNKMLSTLNSLVDSAVNQSWDTFINFYKDLPEDIRRAVHNLHRNIILQGVLQGNIELFGTIKEDIREEDYYLIYRSLSGFLSQHNEALTRDFVNWFCDVPGNNKRDFYPIFLRNLWLLDLLLDKVREDMARAKNIEIIQDLVQEIYRQFTEREKHDEVIEEKVLEVCCELFGRIPNKDVAGILKVLKKLPTAKKLKLHILRSLIKFILGDSGDLISMLKEQKYQPFICELLSEGIKAIDWQKYKGFLKENGAKSFMSRWVK